MSAQIIGTWNTAIGMLTFKRKANGWYLAIRNDGKQNVELMATGNTFAILQDEIKYIARAS